MSVENECGCYWMIITFDCLLVVENISIGGCEHLQFQLTLALWKLGLTGPFKPCNMDFLPPQADKYSRLVTEPLATLQATPSPGFIRTRIQLPMPSDYGLSLRAFNPVDENSVVSIIFQVMSTVAMAVWLL